MNVNNQFKIDDINLTKYLFFTGKVGLENLCFLFDCCVTKGKSIINQN